MAGFIDGIDREQVTLFPDRLEDWIDEAHLVRVVDLFVEGLDLPALGFERCVPARTGRPGYHPAMLLKLFIYGHMNRIPSSRRLEREAGRNVELMWLTGRLVPDHKTIADFRRDNGVAIRRTCAQFVELCRRIGVLKGDCVAIDGSKFKAVNNRDRNFTKNKIASRLAHLEADVSRYVDDMARIDHQEEGEARADKVAHLARRYGRIRQEIARLKAMKQALTEAPDGQISLTDPDARAMATSARHSGMVGYNVQTAVDTETHLIVAHDVTNQGFDRDQLRPMAAAARKALRRDDLHAISKHRASIAITGEASRSLAWVVSKLKISIWQSGSAIQSCPNVLHQPPCMCSDHEWAGQSALAYEASEISKGHIEHLSSMPFSDG